MFEKIVQFGTNKNMLGIVSEPKVKNKSLPAVLLLNSGLIHRVGPNRMSVTLARQLAELGFLVFRFDLPSIGDSAPSDSSEQYQQRTSRDIGMAMDAISKRYKSESFVSIGICTGAMNSHIVAVNDSRVVAAVMLDGYCYPNMKYWVNRYGKKLNKILSPKVILQKVKNLFITSAPKQAGYSEQGVDYWELPAKNVIANELKKLVDRKVKLLFIYTGGLLYFYNYENQLRDNFRSVGFGKLLQVHHLKKVDHTFTLKRDRQVLFNILSEWLKSNFYVDNA